MGWWLVAFLFFPSYIPHKFSSNFPSPYYISVRVLTFSFNSVCFDFLFITVTYDSICAGEVLDWVEEEVMLGFQFFLSNVYVYAKKPWPSIVFVHLIRVKKVEHKQKVRKFDMVIYIQTHQVVKHPTNFYPSYIFKIQKYVCVCVFQFSLKPLMTLLLN